MVFKCIFLGNQEASLLKREPNVALVTCLVHEHVLDVSSLIRLIKTPAGGTWKVRLERKTF